MINCIIKGANEWGDYNILLLRDNDPKRTDFFRSAYSLESAKEKVIKYKLNLVRVIPYKRRSIDKHINIL